MLYLINVVEACIDSRTSFTGHLSSTLSSPIAGSQPKMSTILLPALMLPDQFGFSSSLFYTLIPSISSLLQIYCPLLKEDLNGNHGDILFLIYFCDLLNWVTGRPKLVDIKRLYFSRETDILEESLMVESFVQSRPSFYVLNMKTTMNY